MIWPFKKRQAEQSTSNIAAGMLNNILSAMDPYKLGRKDRPREAFQPDGYSGDRAISDSQDLVSRRVRDLMRNAGQAKRIRSMLTNLVVGKGMQTFAWPFDPSEMLELITEMESVSGGDLGPRLKYALESDDLYECYSGEKKQFDIEERLTRYDMERMLMSECVSVGSGLMLRVFRKDFSPSKHKIPIAWQMFEREQLDISKDRDEGKDRSGRPLNRIMNGIELDSLNRIVAYHLLLNHPHDFFGVNQSSMVGIPAGAGGKSVRVTADRVVDLTLYDRPSSHVGVSWLAPAGQPIWDRDQYCESEIRAAASEAVLLLVAKLANGSAHGAWGFNDGTDDQDQHDNREFKLGHSPVASVIDKDEHIELIKPNRPNRDAGPFLKVLDRDTAASVDLSYHTVSGDYESVTFTSGRHAKMDEELSIAPLQDWFGRSVSLPVRRMFNAAAVTTGLMKTMRPVAFRDRYATYQRFDVIGNGRSLVDPYKEGEARTARLRTGLSTFREECAKRNQHWIRVLMQRSLEKQIFSMFGVEPDFTKAGNGVVEQSQSQDDQQTVEDEA